MPTILAAEFETSAADPTGWPAEGPAEIAFVGRSNVGKSSLLNVLAARRGLARTSAEPGRTRLLNFFQVELRTDGGERLPLRFVDLPGFGYAKVSKAERAAWRPLIERYLVARRALRAVVLLVDARRVPARAGEADDALSDEIELFRWIASRGVPVVPVMTKADKLGKSERARAVQRLRQALGGAAPVLFSAPTGEGRERVLAKLIEAVAPVSDPAPGDDAPASE